VRTATSSPRVHLVDMNLVMDDLVALAQSQATAWLAAH
jgi:hypothetical protein